MCLSLSFIFNKKQENGIDTEFANTVQHNDGSHYITKSKQGHDIKTKFTKKFKGR